MLAAGYADGSVLVYDPNAPPAGADGTRTNANRQAYVRYISRTPPLRHDRTPSTIAVCGSFAPRYRPVQAGVYTVLPLLLANILSHIQH